MTKKQQDHKVQLIKLCFLAAFILVVSTACAIPINMQGINRMSDIQVKTADLISTHDILDLSLGVEVRVNDNVIPLKSKQLLKENIESSLATSLSNLNMFKHILVKSKKTTEPSDITLSVNFNFTHLAYDDLQYTPLAILTAFIITPSHVETQALSELFVSSVFANDSLKEDYFTEGIGKTYTGVIGHGDAVAESIQKTSSELVERITEFVMNNYSFFQSIYIAKQKKFSAGHTAIDSKKFMQDRL